GSVNGMPSSITSAPAFGKALISASEVSPSGSPAVRKVTSAARPCAFSSAKRLSILVLMRGGKLGYTSPRWGEVGRVCGTAFVHSLAILHSLRPPGGEPH